MDVGYALRRARQLHPEAIAVYDGERSITFAQFADRVARVAGALRDLGVQPGDRVAVLMLNSLRYFELYHAVPLAGAMIVPINIRWNPAEIGFGLSDSGARLLVVDDYFARIAPALSASLPAVAYLFAGNGPCPAGMADYEARLPRPRPSTLDGPLPDENDVVALFYTSGSTGGPEGRDADPQEPLRERHARHGGAGDDQGLGVAARRSHVSRGGCDGGLFAGDAGRPELLHSGFRSGSVPESHRTLPGDAHCS